MLNFFKKKNKKRNLQGITSYYFPRCKKEQAIPNSIVYAFTKGKNFHPGGETLFVCTNCEAPVKPKEKE